MKFGRESVGLCSISTFPMMHLICPPKFCITFVFHFFWVLQLPKRNRKHCLCEFLGGANKVHCGECGSGVPCSMKILQEFYFADWRLFMVCGNKFLRFEMTEISGGN